MSSTSPSKTAATTATTVATAVAVAATMTTTAATAIASATSSGQFSASVILIAKFDYKANEPHELDLRKGERLCLIDNTKQWWLVKRLEGSTEQVGYVPSNYVKKEKKSLLGKIIPRRLQASGGSLSAPISCISAQSSDIKNYYHHANNQLLPQSNEAAQASQANVSATVSKSNNNGSDASQQAAPINFIGRATVKHKYTAAKPDELTLNVGVRVHIMEKFGDGWWRIANVENDAQSPQASTNQQQQKITIGLYPSNYLQEETTQTTVSQNGSFNSSSTTPSSKSSNNIYESNEMCALHKYTVKLMPSSSSSDGNYQEATATASRLPADQRRPNSHPSHRHHSNGNDEPTGASSNNNNEKEIEYVRVLYPCKGASIHMYEQNHIEESEFELSVERNEILRVLDEFANDERIRVLNSCGLVGLVSSRCVEPLILDQEFVFPRRPALIGSLAPSPWYFGSLSRHEAIALMNQYGARGDYLVRDSDNGDFSITLKSDANANKHFKIYSRDERFVIGKRVFSTMQELIEHYHRHPIYDQNGEKLFLVQPFRPPSFDAVFQQHRSFSYR